MRICFLAPSRSSHIRKWTGYFLSKGHEVHLVSFDSETIDGAFHHRIRTNVDPSGSDVSKLKYLTSWRKAKGIIDSIEPDIVSAHYASSYGSLAGLACDGKYMLSVWGSDIYEFPRKSPLHKALVKYSLSKAGALLSTSEAMAEEAAKYTDKKFEITPFGVNTDLFKPEERDNERFTVATVKTLSPKYGIDVLIKAVAEVRRQRPDIDLVIKIAGEGPQEVELKALADGLNLTERVEWLGYISQQEAAKVWAGADIAVVPSSSESFGVSAVEAQSCGVPVIVSDVPGLIESTIPDRSSLVFPKGNHCALAERIIEMYDNDPLREMLGRCGRENVMEKYSYEKCFGEIERLFLAYSFANASERSGFHMRRGAKHER